MHIHLQRVLRERWSYPEKQQKRQTRKEQQLSDPVFRSLARKNPNFQGTLVADPALHQLLVIG